MSEKIAVFGSTGNIGGLLTQKLAAAGYNVSGITRDKSKAISSGNISYIQYDYHKDEIPEELFTGTDRIFLASAPLDKFAPEFLNPVINRAKESGVKHIVFLSAMGANLADEAPLNIIEKHLKSSGLNYTILRPTFFMENFYPGFLSETIKGAGKIFVAADEKKSAFISSNDIAVAAFSVITSDKFFGGEYDMTGPETLTYSEAAKILSDKSGKQIEYVPISEDDMKNAMLDNGAPESVVEYLAGLFASVRAGYADRLTDGVETLTGRKPESLTEYAEKVADKL